MILQYQAQERDELDKQPLVSGNLAISILYSRFEFEIIQTYSDLFGSYARTKRFLFLFFSTEFTFNPIRAEK